MKTYHLQREFAFVCPDPHDADSPLKKCTRVLLERLAFELDDELGPPQYPKFIDAKLHDGHEILASVKAENFIAAKKMLGYPLTTVQDIWLTAYQAKKVLEHRAA